MFTVDLNCDMGEDFGVYNIGADESKLMDHITSANIACGFHAGDPDCIKKTVQLAIDKGISIGAHPGLPDLVGFGRRNMNITAQEAYNMVLYQIGALSAFVQAAGSKLNHVKPHGALYNMAAKDVTLARSIAQAVFDFDPTLILFGAFNSELIRAGEKINLKTVNEVFADRTYQADGSLTPRTQPNCFVTDEVLAFTQVLEMITSSRIKTTDGEYVAIEADTVCVHGDGPHALTFVKALRQKLTEHHIVIQPFGALP
jgi:5-oxoprolinase (ATP-hydrolysing) subunit A